MGAARTFRRLPSLLAPTLSLLALGGCGAAATTTTSAPGGRHAPPSQVARTATLVPTAAVAPTTAVAAPPPPPPLVVRPTSAAGASWRAVARVNGRPAAWQAQRGGVTLLRFDQELVRLHLHAGEAEPSGTWRYGSQVMPSEIHHVIAAFNGGFKFTTGDAGWMVAGRVAEPLQAGRGSIVTYTDGTTAIGAWQQGVPASGRPVYSVLQNLSLLIDRGQPAANAEGCITTCWGATVGGVDVTARSGLGIRSDGQLVWAAGEHLTPLQLADVLRGAGVQRAVQLDINPDWVAAYLYRHGGGGPSWSQIVPGQLGIAGHFLAPYSRDFFAVVGR
jgi:hypothetical protein